MEKVVELLTAQERWRIKMATTSSFPSTLYHYTSSHVMYSIVQNKSIWLSINHHLNDYREGVGFIDALRKYFGKDQKKADEILQRLSGFDCFMTCMSTHKDMLSQWRGYSVNGAGVSIGFRKDALIGTISGHPIALLKDINYTDDHNSIISSNSSLLKAVQDSTGTPTESFLQSVVKEKWLIKNKAFSEESEYRLLLTPSNGRDDIDLNNKAKAVRKYRPTETDIRTYFELSFTINPDDLIEEIVLGPKNTSDIGTVKSFLKSCGFTNTEVTKSAASYR